MRCCNHEFYGHDIDLAAEFEAAAPENVTVLTDGVLAFEQPLVVRFGYVLHVGERSDS